MDDELGSAATSTEDPSGSHGQTEFAQYAQWSHETANEIKYTPPMLLLEGFCNCFAVQFENGAYKPYVAVADLTLIERNHLFSSGLLQRRRQENVRRKLKELRRLKQLSNNTATGNAAVDARLRKFLDTASDDEDIADESAEEEEDAMMLQGSVSSDDDPIMWMIGNGNLPPGMDEQRMRNNTNTSNNALQSSPNQQDLVDVEGNLPGRSSPLTPWSELLADPFFMLQRFFVGQQVDLTLPNARLSGIVTYVHLIPSGTLVKNYLTLGSSANKSASAAKDSSFTKSSTNVQTPGVISTPMVLYNIQTDYGEFYCRIPASLISLSVS